MRAYDTVHATRSPKRNTLDIEISISLSICSARRKHFRTALAPTDTQDYFAWRAQHSKAVLLLLLLNNNGKTVRACECVCARMFLCRRQYIQMCIRKKSRGVKSCCWCGKAKAKQSTQRASGPAVAISGGGSLHRARRGTHRQHRRASAGRHYQFKTPLSSHSTSGRARNKTCPLRVRAARVFRFCCVPLFFSR
jgi:hypothetical protein